MARIYAELLKELKVLPESKVEETSGAALMSGGVAQLQKHLKELEAGGVLFLDEVRGRRERREGVPEEARMPGRGRRWRCKR